MTIRFFLRSSISTAAIALVFVTPTAANTLAALCGIPESSPFYADAAICDAANKTYPEQTIEACRRIWGQNKFALNDRCRERIVSIGDELKPALAPSPDKAETQLDTKIPAKTNSNPTIKRPAPFVDYLIVCVLFSLLVYLAIFYRTLILPLLIRLRLAPPPPGLRDPASAREAMTLARSYLEELDRGELWQPPEVDAMTRRPSLDTLRLTAKQLRIAARADASATISIESKDGLPLPLSLRDLEAMTLFYEAWCRFDADPKSAIRAAKRAAHIGDDRMLLWYWVGMFNYLFYNKWAAIKGFKHALSLAPDNLTSRKGLDRARNLSIISIIFGKLSWTLSEFLTLAAWFAFFGTIALGIFIARILIEQLNILFIQRFGLPMPYVVNVAVFFAVLLLFGILLGFYKGLFMRGYFQFLGLFNRGPLKQ
jgi:hypothetical protein